MKTIIAGSRSISDWDMVNNIINSYIADSDFEITEVVSGRAEGVDILGEKWAKHDGRDIPIKKFPYKKFLKESSHPKHAPLLRNKKMAEYADAAIIIWDGESSGTKNMIKNARKQNLELYIHRTDSTSLFEF